MIDQLASLLTKFVKPAAITEVGDITKLELEKDSIHKNDEDIQIGYECKMFLQENKDQLDLPAFYSSVKSFLISSSTYMLQKYPYNDDVLVNAEVLDISIRTGKKFKSVEYFNDRFHIVAPENMDKLESEFNLYQVDDTVSAISKEDLRIDEKWHKIGQLKDFRDGYKYVTLSSVMKAVLVIFHSNSDCERIFSVVEKNKTKQRASLGTETLGALLCHKMAMQNKGQKCSSAKYSSDVLRNAKKATYLAQSLKS